MKILCIGHSSYDITAPIAQYPTENTKNRIENCLYAGGGPAANAAYLLGKWGMDTTFVGIVGYDSFGTNIKAELKAVNVDTEFLEINYEEKTSTSFILVNEQNGSRTVFNCANTHPQIKKFKFDINPDIILVDGHQYEASKWALTRWPNAIGIIDAGRVTKELLDLCKYVKYLVCSKEFAETATGMKFDYNNPKTIANLYLNLQDKYKNANIVVTLEDKGALYAHDKVIKILPSIPKSVVKDTTGAGDIFHGAFTYAIANGYDIEKTIKLSNITAGLSIEKLGARLSIPDLAEVLDYYEKHQ